MPETRKIRERDVHIMTRRKYDPKKGKMCDRDTRKQNPAESTKKKNVSCLHSERQIARWIELHNDMVING